MSRATLSGLHVGSNLVFCTCSLSIDPTSHITGVTVSHELFRMNPSEPFAPSYRGTISLIYPDQLSPLPFCHILHQCTSTQVHRHTPVHKWYTGTPVFKCIGISVQSYTGISVNWYCGTPAHRCMHWCIGTSL